MKLSNIHKSRESSLMTLNVFITQFKKIITILPVSFVITFEFYPLSLFFSFPNTQVFEFCRGHLGKLSTYEFSLFHWSSLQVSANDKCMLLEIVGTGSACPEMLRHFSDCTPVTWGSCEITNSDYIALEWGLKFCISKQTSR